MLPQAEQLPFPFFLDEEALQTFITQLWAIENEEDRLREEKRLLVERYKEDMPMRAVRTAIKVVRARQKLADHAKEPMRYVHQGALEALVERQLLALKHDVEVPDLTDATG